MKKLPVNLASAHHFQLTLVLFTYQLLLGNSKTRDITLAGMVILDLQKAFDTVNHKILLVKLHAMGVGQIVVQWFNSYLSGRQQLVNIVDTNSDFRNILCGVPQGFILGSLLCLVYVNDTKAAVQCKLLLYAGDSALLVSGKDVLEIERILSVELGAVSEWLCENRLSLPLGKTQSILFSLKKRISK